MFERYIDICSYIYCKGYDKDFAKTELMRLTWESYSIGYRIKFNYSLDEYKSMLSPRLIGHYPDYPYGVIRNCVVYLLRRENDEYIYTHEEFLSMSKSALDDFIKHDSQFKSLHLELLYDCIANINQNTHKIILDKDSCSQIKKLILKNPKDYFTNFVRLGGVSSSPNFNSVACEPYWR